MKKTKTIVLKVLCGLFIVTISAQQKIGPNTISKGIFKGETKLFKDYPKISESIKEKKDIGEITIISNNLKTGKRVNQNALPIGTDPKRQSKQGVYSNKSLKLNIEGINSTEAGNVLPPDPTGAVGPNHYVLGVNLAIKIFDKKGDVLAGPTSLADFLGSGNNDGDPIVLYDHLADRFFVSQFKVATNALVVAVSKTPDPTGAYKVYEFPLDSFPDYPKYAIWPNGYYLTAMKEGSSTYVLERNVMIEGGENPKIIGFNLPEVVRNENTIFSPEPANLLGNNFAANVPGYVVYFQDDSWSSDIVQDHIKIWEIDIDFSNPEKSTVSQPTKVTTVPFESVFSSIGGDVEQPGTTQKIDAMSGIISYAVNYRAFDNHNSLLMTFNVNVDNNNTSGIRWIELRNSSSGGWKMYQEGTYAPDDGHSRFMGSAGIDARGNIGLAFNIGSATLFPSIRYTGRYASDALGEMTLEEKDIIIGNGVQINSNRFGDYSHLTMDPDQFTFWHTAEYLKEDDIWASRIASFSLGSNFSNDVGGNTVVKPSNGLLSSSEAVEVSIRNYGVKTQQNIPLELWLDGVLIASETFIGTIETDKTSTYTFERKLDLSGKGQTYVIEVKTRLEGDGEERNDTVVKNVEHLLTKDVGITEIIAPSTGSGLGTEAITVDITNFGGETVENIELQYTLDGQEPVIEMFTGTIASEKMVSYTFAKKVDLSVINKIYTIEAKTNLTGDLLSDNDSSIKTVKHTVCIPKVTVGCNAEGLKKFILNTINVDDGKDGCNTEGEAKVIGYADRTNLSTTLLNISGENEYILQAQQNWNEGAESVVLSAWIDFNDNFVFEQSEQLIKEAVFQSSDTLENFYLTIPVGANKGKHILRVKVMDPFDGDASSPCEDFASGEVHDYTVIIDDVLSTIEQEFNKAELIVLKKQDDKFEVTLRPQVLYDAIIYMSVLNIAGQELAIKPFSKIGKEYKINLNMDRAQSGIYFLKVIGVKNRMVKTIKIAIE